eukprot:jgi/Mesvir1/24806/Mv22057-RA.3
MAGAVHALSMEDRGKRTAEFCLYGDSLKRGRAQKSPNVQHETAIPDGRVVWKASDTNARSDVETSAVPLKEGRAALPESIHNPAECLEQKRDYIASVNLPACLCLASCSCTSEGLSPEVSSSVRQARLEGRAPLVDVILDCARDIVSADQGEGGRGTQPGGLRESGTSDGAGSHGGGVWDMRQLSTVTSPTDVIPPSHHVSGSSDAGASPATVGMAVTSAGDVTMAVKYEGGSVASAGMEGPGEGQAGRAGLAGCGGAAALTTGSGAGLGGMAGGPVDNAGVVLEAAGERRDDDVSDGDADGSSSGAARSTVQMSAFRAFLSQRGLCGSSKLACASISGGVAETTVRPAAGARTSEPVKAPESAMAGPSPSAGSLAGQEENKLEEPGESQGKGSPCSTSSHSQWQSCNSEGSSSSSDASSRMGPVTAVVSANGACAATICSCGCNDGKGTVAGGGSLAAGGNAAVTGGAAALPESPSVCLHMLAKGGGGECSAGMQLRELQQHYWRLRRDYGALEEMYVAAERGRREYASRYIFSVLDVTREGFLDADSAYRHEMFATYGREAFRTCFRTWCQLYGRGGGGQAPRRSRAAITGPSLVPAFGPSRVGGPRGIGAGRLAPAAAHVWAQGGVWGLAAGCGGVSGGARDYTMSMDEMLHFISLAEDKSTKASQSFWFQCLDLDGNGYLTRDELKFFYESVDKSRQPACVSFSDLMCQVGAFGK